MSRINIFDIIKSHILTFRNIKKRRADIKGLFFMFGFPLIISVLLVYYKVDNIRDHVSDLLTFESITGGFLFTLLALIYSIMDKIKISANVDDIKNIYSKEVHTNISFGIAIAIFSTISLIAFSFKTPFKAIEPFIVNLTAGWIHYTLIVFTLNLLLILKRIFILLDNP